MAVKDRVTIELYVDDQGTIKVVQARKAVEELGAAGKQSMSEAAGGADDFAGALVRQLGIYALVTAAAWKLEEVVVGGFKAGLQVIDDYRLNTIGVAATLTDIASDQTNLQKTYTDNIAYSRDMYNELELAAARHFASGKDGIQAFNILTQKGIVLRKEEIDDLFVIVDKIKLATAGQVQAIQISQELRAMLSGQARQTDQLAMIIKDRYGSAWEDILKKHRQAGDLVHWLATEFQGLQYASADVQGTLYSQKTTLATLLGQVGRAGLTGAYDDIAGLLRQGNDYLREHREEIGGGIARGWQAVRDLAEGTYGAIKGIYTIVSAPITWSIKIATSIIGPGASFLASGTEGGTYSVTTKMFPWSEEKTTMVKIAASPDFGFGAAGPDTGQILADQEAQTKASIKKYFQNTTETFLEEQKRQNRALSAMVATRLPDIAALSNKAYETGGLRYSKIGGATIDTFLPDWMRSGLPQVKSPAPEAPGGGKGADSALNSMQTLVDRLQQDISRLSEGSLAAVDAWYDKTMNDIAKLVAKGADGADAEALAWQAAGLKKGKIVDDFWLMIDKKTGEGFAAIDKKYLEDLQKFQGIEGAKAALDAVWQKETFDLQQKYAKDIEDLRKSSLSTLAANTPFLIDQLGFQRKIMDVEIQRQQIALERKIVDDHIPAAQAEELRGLNALADASRRYAQQRKEWETQGIGGGLNIWATERQAEMQKRAALETVELLKNAESWLGDTFGQNALATMRHEKKNFQKLWQDIMGDALTWVFKHSVRTLGDAGAGLFGQQGRGAGGAGGIGGQRGGGDPYGLTQAGQSLQEAGVGFNLNTAQFGLAAGGLLLSGLGIMTNSQALVVAGMVLQMAGLAIQIYQALTATSTMSEMTMAAGALMLAADMLMIAAAVPGYHTGGVVAHQGLLVAHGGLNTDERLVKVLTGEPILQRSAWAAYQRMGLSFEDLNNGRLPAVPVPVGNFTTPGRQSRDGGQSITINIGDIHLPVTSVQQVDHETVRKHIMPKLKTELQRHLKDLVKR